MSVLKIDVDVTHVKIVGRERKERSRFLLADVVGSGVAGFNLGLHASRILCLDLDSSRTGAFGDEVDVV